MRLFLVLFLVMALAVTVTAEDNRIEEDFAQRVLRLHIVPNSDQPRDQALKLAVRDVLLREIGPELAEAGSAQEAYRWVAEGLDRVEALAREELRRQGREDPVAVNLKRAHFPAKEYGGRLFPAGEYQAVQVLIGEGAGDNWWCVLFPPLCLGGDTGVRAAEEREEEKEQPKIRFRLLELFKGKE